MLGTCFVAIVLFTVSSLACAEASSIAVLELIDPWQPQPDDSRVTSCRSVMGSFAQLGVATLSLSFACAGHPPPGCRTRGKPAKFVWDGRSLPINAYADCDPRPESHLSLELGGTLVMYTDGLIEHRDRANDGMARLLKTVAGGRHHPFARLGRVGCTSAARSRRGRRCLPAGSAPELRGRTWSAPSSRGARCAAMASEHEPEGITVGPDGRPRCRWANSTDDYRAYHDTEWGFPVSEDVRLFEKLTLEGFQAGLSWLTILRKREAFRSAFAGFEFSVVAAFGEADVQRLLADAGIIRHRGKIEAAINNAARAVELVATEGSLAAYVWSYEPPSRPAPLTHAELAAQPSTPESAAMASDLKRRGWRFLGPTTVYAFMQAMGLVNDHLAGCESYDQVRAARGAFAPPGAAAGSSAAQSGGH